MSPWDILGIAIILGPLTLAFISLIAWFVYAASEDFVVKPRRAAQKPFDSEEETKRKIEELILILAEQSKSHR